MATGESQPRHLELTDYIRIISRRKWSILMVTAAATLVGGLYALLSETGYEATAFVLIQQRPRDFLWITGEDLTSRQTVAMETHAHIIGSSHVAELAAERMAELPQSDRIIVTPGEIMGALRVSVVHPDLLRISCISADERKARMFANYVATSFVEVETRQRQRESLQRREFLELQVDETRQELDLLINEMAKMARDTGYIDIDAEIGGIISDLRGYENRRRDAEAALKADQARLSELIQMQDKETQFFVREEPQANPEWEMINRRFIEARVQMAQLSSQYTESHPQVVEVAALMERLRRELEEIPQLVELPVVRQNPAAVDIERDIRQARISIDEARAKISASDQVIDRLETRLQDLPEERQRWVALAERLAAMRETYQGLQRDLRAAHLAEAIKQGTASVIDEAYTARPIEASLGRSLVFAGAIGLFVGLAMAVLLEALNDTIYSIEDLKLATDLHLLGVVPLRTDESGPLITVDAPRSPPAEAYRTLRSNVRFSLFDSPTHTLLITSAGTGEGKSATAANLAVACAQRGDSVILVDTDLRRPVLHRLFDVGGDPGVTSVLVGDAGIEDVLQNTEVPGLRVIAGGPLPPNPSELLESKQMKKLIESLKQLADLVIFDSPPCVMLTDAVVMASRLERTILVVEAGKITRRAIEEVERTFRHARADLLGVVLNKLNPAGGDRHSYQYYYYDYSSRIEPSSHDSGSATPGDV